MDSADDRTGGRVVLLTERVPPAVMAAADRAKAEAQKVTDERRAHRRVPGRTLKWIEVARVKYGPEVNIVDLSRTGVLLESDRPLAPGSRQALEIAGAERSIVVPFGVLRSRITAIEPRGAIYRAACAFSRPLELPELPAATAQAPAPAATLPPAGVPPAVQAIAPQAAKPESPQAAKPESLMDTVLRETKEATESSIQANGCQKIVARFVDGTILKGFNTDFDVNRPSFSLLQTPDVTADSVSVPLTNLKAVFFVRDFAGNPEYRERKTFIGDTQGRRIHLTFNDGEMIIGTTQSYRAGGVGFYVTPVDPRANNVRIFVLSNAVRQVRFP
jgi:Family of unknown function (DUF6982)